MGLCPTNGASGVNSTVGQGLPVWVKWAPALWRRDTKRPLMRQTHPIPETAIELLTLSSCKIVGCASILWSARCSACRINPAQYKSRRADELETFHLVQER